MRIQQSTQGLQRAERQILSTSSRIAQWGIQSPNAHADSVQIDGLARPMRYGSKPPYVSSISNEVVQLKQASFAYRANAVALQTTLDMDDTLLELDQEEDRN